MVAIVGGPNAYNAVDVCLVRSIGASQTQLYLRNGSTLTLSQAIAAVLLDIEAATDVEAFTLGPFTSPTIPGTLYVVPQNVARAQPVANGLAASIVTLEGANVGPLYVPMPFATLLLGLQAASPPWTSGEPPSPPLTTGRYVPIVTGLGDVTANPAPLDQFSFAEFVATDDDDPNLIMVAGSLNMSSLAGVTDVALATVSLPIEMSQEFSNTVSLRATGARWQDAPGTPIPLAVTTVNSGTVRVSGSLPAGVNVYANLALTYNRAGV